MTWPQDAYVGQKVVCMKPPRHPPQKPAPIPIIGEVYVIKALTMSPSKILHFELEEVSSEFYDAMNWAWHMFRPVQSTSTGFVILARLQNPANHRHLEDA